jgi:hypothetical protein
MEEAANSAKLDKITTPAAQAAADKLRNFVKEYTTKIQSYL